MTGETIQGDMNQDGFPDLVVGAYGSGTAGEAFVVFPGLTGTPPPTPSPTPAPTGPTPAPFDSGIGETPAPTVNFLMPGVVGAGTVYDSPGVFVRAQELGGEVTIVPDHMVGAKHCCYPILLSQAVWSVDSTDSV